MGRLVAEIMPFENFQNKTLFFFFFFLVNNKKMVRHLKSQSICIFFNSSWLVVKDLQFF